MLDFTTLSLPVLLGIFAGAAGVVWMAGIWLSNAASIVSTRFHLGQALGGLILLAVATNLPELAITSSAAISGNLSIAIGNILGGIAIQTVVLVILDVFGVGAKSSLTYRAASLTLVLEAALVIAVLAVVVMGSQFPATFHFARITPASLLIALLWVSGVWLLGRARQGLPWHEQGQAPDSPQAARGTARTKSEQKASQQGVSTRRALLLFLFAAGLTLVAGVVLERSGDAIAGQIGMTGVLFGATVLAASTSIPEVSTGLTSIKQGDVQLACSDIFGGNAFLPVLFLLADLLSGQAVLPQAQPSDLYLTGLGALLTAVYIYGLIFRPKRQVARMGIDSLVVLILYVLGVAGLLALPRGG